VSGLGDTVAVQVNLELFQVAAIGDGGSRRTFLGSEVVEELLQSGSETHRLG